MKEAAAGRAPSRERGAEAANKGEAAIVQPVVRKLQKPFEKRAKL